MKTKIIFTLLLTLLNAIVFAKTLKVNCQSNEGDTLNLVSTIKNSNTPQSIKSLSVDQKKVLSFRDISKMPIYKDGNLSLRIQFGANLYSSAVLTLTKCNDEFEATGKSTIEKYVGGFAGTEQLDMSCTCSLK